MPVAVDNVDSSVEVQSPAAHSEPAPNETNADALQRFQKMAQRQIERAARTSAWNFDD